MSQARRRMSQLSRQKEYSLALKQILPSPTTSRYPALYEHEKQTAFLLQVPFFTTVVGFSSEFVSESDVACVAEVTEPVLTSSIGMTRVTVTFVQIDTGNCLRNRCCKLISINRDYLQRQHIRAVMHVTPTSFQKRCVCR